LQHRTEVNAILETTIKSLEKANASFESAYTSLDETNSILEETITRLEEEVLVAAREQQKTKALLDKVVLVVNTLGNTEVQSAVSAPSL
jgi:tmRNA-binding protein